MNNKLKVFDCEFAAKITVAAYSPRQAAERAARILDNEHCYLAFVHEAYLTALDPMELSAPPPVPERDLPKEREINDEVPL